ncbi:MAG: hypothetical protein AAB355_00825 [Patescibacteria group bacterium]
MQNGKPNGTDTKTSALGRFSIRATRWIGSTPSLITHTFLFVGAFVLVYMGVDFDRVLLALTTVVSLEAIYLAIFIQMTINRTTAQLKDVEQDIEEISEDIEEIHENVEDIQEDVEEITVGEEIEETTENAKLEKIEQSLLTIVKEIEELKKGTATPKS